MAKSFVLLAGAEGALWLEAAKKVSSALALALPHIV
jgi:hypothetical protein